MKAAGIDNGSDLNSGSFTLVCSYQSALSSLREQCSAATILAIPASPASSNGPTVPLLSVDYDTYLPYTSSQLVQTASVCSALFNRRIPTSLHSIVAHLRHARALSDNELVTVYHHSISSFG